MQKKKVRLVPIILLLAISLCQAPEYITNYEKFKKRLIKQDKEKSPCEVIYGIYGDYLRNKVRFIEPTGFQKLKKDVEECKDKEPSLNSTCNTD